MPAMSWSYREQLDSAIITGGTSGIGLEAARQFSNEGARLENTSPSFRKVANVLKSAC
jgi:NAD(P)-dependent dehydrogenase (short-subunit alcohol dehydrogenase family)